MADKRDDFSWEEIKENVEENRDSDEFEEELEEESPHPLMTAGVFLGLVVLAAIICAVLWSVTHREDEGATNATESVQDTVVEETLSDGEAGGALGEEIESIEQTESQTIESEVIATQEGIQSEGNISGSAEDEVTLMESSEQELISVEMTFYEATDTVTAKEVTNLRSAPTTADAENVVAQLLNGEILSRTGMNEDTGWSRLDYNGQTVYAVSAYLTTDLSYEADEVPVVSDNPNRVMTQDGREIIFDDCDDYVMAKEYVNLRLEPSTSQGNASIHCQIRHGDLVHRTGYSEDSGWSRVEYDGRVLYVVSSMVYSAE